MTPNAFAPATLGGLALRNRVIKTATYEGMSPGGVPSDALVEHHRELAAGGVGLTTVAYCAVSPDGRTFAEQMVMNRETVTPLARVTDAVHREGGAASLQLGHCGWFTKNTELSTWLPRGPSLVVNQYGISVGKPVGLAMNEREIAALIEDFGRAAGLARKAGFDAVELHLGHGYLLSQFLCPATNRRRDAWGGDLAGRARLALAVLRRVREEVGAGLPVLCKTNLRDGFRGGLELDESVALARLLEAEGADALVLSGGFTSRTPFYLFRGRRPLAEMIDAEKSRLQKLALRWFGRKVIREYPFEEMFFLPQAREVRRAVRMPLVLLGGIVSRSNVDAALAEGFDFVAMGRALIADPDLVKRMATDASARSRCTHCNVCVAEMDLGGVRCVLDGPRPQPSQGPEVDAYVSLGSNLGDREAHLAAAIEALRARPGMRVTSVSKVYETAPVGPPPQGPYLNAALRLRTRLAPRALLACLLEIEAAEGRQRSDSRWSARTLDLDLLFYGSLTLDEPGLRVPHPHLHERAFVLEPLRDLAPQLVHPLLGKTVEELARKVRDPGAVVAFQLGPRARTFEKANE